VLASRGFEERRLQAERPRTKLLLDANLIDGGFLFIYLFISCFVFRVSCFFFPPYSYLSKYILLKYILRCMYPHFSLLNIITVFYETSIRRFGGVFFSPPHAAKQIGVAGAR